MPISCDCSAARSKLCSQGCVCARTASACQLARSARGGKGAKRAARVLFKAQDSCCARQEINAPQKQISPVALLPARYIRPLDRMVGKRWQAESPHLRAERTSEHAEHMAKDMEVEHETVERRSLAPFQSSSAKSRTSCCQVALCKGQTLENSRAVARAVRDPTTLKVTSS